MSSLLDTPLHGVARQVQEVTEALKRAIPTEAQLRAEIAELENVDGAAMWKASLGLDETNRWIKTAMEGIRQREVISDSTRMLSSFGLVAITTAGAVDRVAPMKSKFAVALGRTGQKLFSSSLVTAWHLKEARYPAGETGYWDPKAYNKATPFVKEIPTLIRHAGTAVNSAIEASEIAKRLSTREIRKVAHSAQVCNPFNNPKPLPTPRWKTMEAAGPNSTRQGAPRHPWSEKRRVQAKH